MKVTRKAVVALAIAGSSLVGGGALATLMTGTANAQTTTTTTPSDGQRYNSFAGNSHDRSFRGASSDVFRSTTHTATRSSERALRFLGIPSDLATRSEPLGTVCVCVGAA